MEKKSSSSTVFKVGAISLAFLILGYQSALFIHKAAVLRIEANRDVPDTVYVMMEAGGDGLRSEAARPDQVERTERIEAPHSRAVQEVRARTRSVESFVFNPNTANAEELQRLGFSEKQAAAICNYRNKGGRFRRKEDFAKSFVVADSVYRRLEPFIEIPKLDINRADSAQFDELPGIGPYFAAQMVRYREQLGGYVSTEQLMDIKYFDREKYDALSDLISCSADGGPE